MHFHEGIDEHSRPRLAGFADGVLSVSARLAVQAGVFLFFGRRWVGRFVKRVEIDQPNMEQLESRVESERPGQERQEAQKSIGYGSAITLLSYEKVTRLFLRRLSGKSWLNLKIQHEHVNSHSSERH